MKRGEGGVRRNPRILPGSAGPPFPLNSADNGLSVDTLSRRIVLGQRVGQAGDPAQLLNNREIPLAGFSLVINNNGFTKFLLDPFNDLYSFGDPGNETNGMSVVIDNLNNRFFINNATENFFNIDAVNRTSNWNMNATAINLDESSHNIAIETDSIVGGLKLGLDNPSGIAAFHRNVGGNISVGINVNNPFKNLHVLGTTNQFGVTNHASGFNTAFDDPISAVTNAERGLNLTHYANDGLASHIRFFKTRNADPSVNTATANADQLGDISVFGVDTGNVVRQSHRILHSQVGANAGFVSGSIFWQLTNAAGVLGNRMFLGPEGQLGLGTVGPVASAKFEMVSTTQGFLPPRMTTVQKNAIAAPAVGLFIFDTTLAKLCVFTGAIWETVTSV